jgi:hypothetical protein
MPWSGTEIARRIGGKIELRPEALRLRIRLRDITSSDHHLIDVDFTAAVRALDQRGEREMFEEVFLTARESASAEDVSAHFAPPLHRAVCSFAIKQTAAQLLEESSKRPLIDTLLSVAKSVAFSSGVELLAPFDVSLTSPTLQREQHETLEQKLTERRIAGQLQNVQRATELLREFDALRQAMPGLSPGKLLEQVVPANRGTTLQSLLLASSSGVAAMLWAVAGPNLLKIDPRANPPSVTTSELPADLGPLRSVQPHEGRLLVGARSGVLIVDPANLNDPLRLRIPQMTSQLGFNSAVIAGEWLWASHSEAGVIGWKLARPDEPAVTIPLASHPRNLVVLDDGHVVGSAGGTAFVIEPMQTLASGESQILFIAATREHVLLVRESGEITRLHRNDFRPLGTQRVAGETTAAGALPFLGSTRLLLATADGAITCVGGDDPLVTQYLSPHRGLRALAACGDIVAALSADRQRIVLWNSWAGEAPFAEIHVASIARHRAADICFA